MSSSARLPSKPPVTAGPWVANKSRTRRRSEDYLRASVDWLWEADRNLNYVHLSTGAIRTFGLPAETFLGRQVTKMGCPSAHDAGWRGLSGTLRRRRAFRDQVLDVAALDGRARRIALSGVPVFDSSSGTFSGYRGTGREIRQGEKEEASLQELRQSLSDVGQLTDLWYWWCDDRLRLIQLSDNYSQVSGLSTNDCLTQDLVAVWRLGRQARTDLTGRREFRDAPANWFHPELEGRRRYLISGRPIFEANGVFAGYRGIGRDVTELLRAEENANLARAAAEQESRAKSDFLANMSHELRTSLNAIIGFSDAMQSGVLGTADSKSYQAYAKDILESGRHLLDLVNDMLDLSRIEAGHECLSCQAVDIANLIESCCRMLTPEIERRELVLKASVVEDPPRLLVDPSKLRQVLLNLLGNAVKFTPPGGRISIDFRLAEDGAAELEVRDTGVGIKASEIPKILSRFGQADQAEPDSRTGIGLGLAITKSLIELHGGTLAVDSEEGRGARFVVRLPAARIVRDSEG